MKNSKHPDILKVQSLLEEFYSYPESIRLKAEIEQLKERLRNLADLAKVDLDTFMNQSQEVADIRYAILKETNVDALDLNKAIDFCKKKSPSFTKTSDDIRKAVVNKRINYYRPL